jgi:LemA protein
MGLWIAVGIVVLLLFYLVSIYNRLISLRNRVKNGWSQIDVQLRRRHDLIPNLVESVKGYMAHERAIFEAITQARQQAIAAGNDVAARGAAESELTRSLRAFIVQAEAIPELKANQNMLSLQEELSSTENRIAFARQHYNDSVMAYNTAIASVPNNFIAGGFGFHEEVPFAAEESERQPVSVKF